MSKPLAESITDFTAVFKPSVSPAYQFYSLLRATHPNAQLVMVNRDSYEPLDVEGFLASKNVEVTGLSGLQHRHFKYHGDKTADPRDPNFNEDEFMVKYALGSSVESQQASFKQVRSSLMDGFFDVVWHGTTLRVYKANWLNASHGQTESHAIVWDGASDEVGRQLVAETVQWQDSLREAVWVFHKRWRKDKAMWAAIQAAKDDDLVLPPDTLAKLEQDTKGFFESKSLYSSLGVPWKRGLLLMGAPGLGKTQTIKALLRRCASAPALYVQSLSAQGGSEVGIEAIFHKARESAPCILVFEDLDSLITPKTRSFFLNQLDGFDSNDGILVVATANDPKKLDDAIMRRPSRFDTRYYFEAPDAGLRERFLWKWIDKIGRARFDLTDGKGEQQYSDLEAAVQSVVEQTQDWSFAFLKELFLSFLLSAASKSKPGDAVSSIKISAAKLVEQAKLLQSQALPSREAVVATKTEEENEEEADCC